MKNIPIQVLSAGITIGKAKFYKKKKYQIHRHKISEEEIQDELKKFEEAIEKVLAEIDTLIENSENTKENMDVLSTHKMILKDPELASNVKNMIKKDLLSLEKALEQHFQQIIPFFENMDNDYLSQRSLDYEDVANRLLDSILEEQQTDATDMDDTSIVIAESAHPSDVAKWFTRKIRGICVEKGSKNCHAAIIARSMSIPFVSGISNIFEQIQEDETIIIDSNLRNIFIEPDAETKDKYNTTIKKELEKSDSLQKLIDVPTQTKDDKTIKLMCNMEIPEELMAVQNVNSEGIGLFRTEFLFMERKDLPEEEEQYKIYKKIAKAVQPHPFIIRTIDVGGDKISDTIQKNIENNPGLGMRGIRISLENKELFAKQIRAILRANEYGNIQIMFPMVSCVEELLQAKKVVQQCIDELKKKQIKRTIKIGTMIEIPAAALNSDILAKECDFFSIGTNDLIQYTLAVDRDNEKVAKYYNSNNLAIIKLIKLTVESGDKENIPVAVCGEMASQPEYIPLLIGLGIKELSVSPGSLLSIKKRILEISAEDCRKQVEKMLQNTIKDEIKLDF